MEQISIQILMFADDMILIADKEEKLQRNIKIYEEELKKIGTLIYTSSSDKT